MAYSADQIKQWMAQGESDRLEFKSHLRDPSLLARLISAFANQAGGVILVGVDPGGEIIGAGPHEVSRVFNLALARLLNAPKVDLEATDVDGKSVVTIAVARSDHITVADAGAFLRVGASDRPLPARQAALKLVNEGIPPIEAQPIGEAIERLTAQIGSLQEQIRNAGTIQAQLPHYLIGGAIGAIIGYFLGPA